MELAELESLGITKEQIIERIVDRCANRMLSTHCGTVNEEGEPVEWDQESPLLKQLQDLLKQRVDAALATIVDTRILPKVSTYIENITLQETNKWGEKKGKKFTFIEYLAQRAEAYLTEKVDYLGKSKDEDCGSFWKGSQTRITHLVHQHLHYSIEEAMKKAVQCGMTVVTKGIQETVKLKLAEVSEKLKVEIQTK